MSWTRFRKFVLMCALSAHGCLPSSKGSLDSTVPRRTSSVWHGLALPVTKDLRPQRQLLTIKLETCKLMDRNIWAVKSRGLIQMRNIIIRQHTSGGERRLCASSLLLISSTPLIFEQNEPNGPLHNRLIGRRWLLWWALLDMLAGVMSIRSASGHLVQYTTMSMYL